MVLLQFVLAFAVWLLFAERALASKSGCTGGYCFTMADNERLTQQNAQQWCRNNGSQLAEILNKDIQDAFTNFIQNFFKQQVTGWYVFTNGGRTIGNWNRVNGNGIGNISVLEQTDLSYAYGYLRSSGSQFDIYAARSIDTKGFICSGRPMSDCSGGITISGQCYKSYTETMSWFDARNRCLDGGGDLATFDFITTNDGVHSLNGSWISPSSNYWIGFRREWWTWKGSGMEVKFSAWSTGNPFYRSNAGCICIFIGDSRQPPWKWFQCDCNEQKSFLCVSGNLTLPTSPSSSTTTTTSYASPSLPVIPSSSTLKSSTRENIHSGGFEQTPSHSFLSTYMDASGLSPQKQIGIGVGVGIGGLILVIAVVIVLIFLFRKRFNSRHFAAGKQKPNPPDLINGQTNEGTYATVISSSQQNNGNADKCSTENPPTVYAPLAITSPKDYSESENIDMKASDASVLYGTVSKRH